MSRSGSLTVGCSAFGTLRPGFNSVDTRIPPERVLGAMCEFASGMRSFSIGFTKLGSWLRLDQVRETTERVHGGSDPRSELHSVRARSDLPQCARAARQRARCARGTARARSSPDSATSRRGLGLHDRTQASERAASSAEASIASCYFPAVRTRRELRSTTPDEEAAR
jgi:hypothetical protein